jgi:hypothetical protein
MLRPLENRASECVKKRGGANGEGGEMCGSGLGGRGAKRMQEEGVYSTKSRKMSQ